MAVVLAAAAVAAGMTLAFVGVVVMAAADVGIVAELAEKQRVHHRIRVSADAAVELYARLCKSRLSAAADAAADKSVNAVEFQKPASAP